MSTYTLVKIPDGNYILLGERCDPFKTINWMKIDNDLPFKVLASVDEIPSVKHIIPQTKLAFADGVSEQIGVSFVRKYTVDEMMQCFEESRLTHPMVGFKHDTFEDFVSSINRTQWQVEVEMEKQHFRTVKDVNGIAYDHEYLLVPKVTNNTIHVLKIIE